MKGPSVSSNLHDFLGEGTWHNVAPTGPIQTDSPSQGIFVADGDQWRAHRKATTKVFAAANFRGFVSTVINTEIAKLKLIVGRYADSGERTLCSASRR